MDRTEMIEKIMAAARAVNFTDEIDDIDVLAYTDKDGNTHEDRFDHIDTTTIPMSVHFIGGTGHKNFNVPIARLTDESLEQLYDCIEQPAQLTDKQKASQVLRYMEDEMDVKTVLNVLNPYLKDEQLAEVYDSLVSDGAFPADGYCM